MADFGITAAMTMASTAMSMMAAKKQANAQSKQARDKARYQNSIVQAQQASRERQAKEALKKSKATQRTRSSAAGVGSGGSAAALLAGMEKQLERDLYDSRFQSGLKSSEINQGLSLLDQTHKQRMDKLRNNALESLVSRGRSLLEQ